MSSSPSRRERLSRERQTNLDQISKLLAHRAGRASDDFEVVLAASVTNSAFAEAARYWLDRNCEPSLKELIEQAMNRIESSLAL